MNKIKVLYDVVKTMKEKEDFKGSLTAEGTKDGEKLISFSNTFEKHAGSGEIKAKISAEINADGNHIKHESEVEFNKECCGHKHHAHIHKFHGKMHAMHHEGGIKCHLSRLGFALNALNNLQVEEKEGGSLLLSLNLKELCGEMKDFCKDKMMHCHEASSMCCEEEEDNKHCKLAKAFFEEDYDSIALNIRVNDKNEVEQVNITASGTKASFQAQLNLSW